MIIKHFTIQNNSLMIIPYILWTDIQNGPHLAAYSHNMQRKFSFKYNFLTMSILEPNFVQLFAQKHTILSIFTFNCFLLLFL